MTAQSQAPPDPASARRGPPGGTVLGNSSQPRHGGAGEAGGGPSPSRRSPDSQSVARLAAIGELLEGVERAIGDLIIS